MLGLGRQAGRRRRSAVVVRHEAAGIASAQFLYCWFDLGKSHEGELIHA